MVGLVIECAVGDNEIGWHVSLEFTGFLHFRFITHHDQGQLAWRLPVLVLFGDFFGVEGNLPALLVVGFGTLCIVDLVLRGTWINS